jgi:uncharacterized metal-binding protein YceD (DUF177 family)
LHHFFYSEVLKTENQYIIHFKGLKEGVHDFAFIIEKPFFDAFEQLEVPDGHVHVQVELHRKTSFLELAVDLQGELQAQCDRCLGHFTLPVSYSSKLVVRFSETEQDTDDEVIFLHPDEYQLNLKHYLYECISLSLPLRKVHPELSDGQPGCDPEMLKRLDEMLIKD